MSGSSDRLPVGSLELQSHRFERLLELVRGRVLEGDLDLGRIALARWSHDAGMSKSLDNKNLDAEFREYLNIDTGSG